MGTAGRVITVALVAACGRAHFDPLAADARRVVTIGNNTDDTFQSTCTETSIDADFPNSNTGNLPTFNADAQNDNARGLLRLDASGLADVALDTAQLELWVDNEVNADSGSCEVGFYRMLEAWEETSATWNVRNTGTPWSMPGADPPSSDPVAIGSLPAPFTLDTLYVLPLPVSIVEGWRTDPAANAGLLLICSTSDGVYFVSSEGADGKRPRLRVTYAP